MEMHTLHKLIPGRVTLLASVLREMGATLVEEECATAVTGGWVLLVTICIWRKFVEFKIGFSGQVTLQGSALREREAVLEEQQSAIAVTGEAKAAGFCICIFFVPGIV